MNFQPGCHVPVIHAGLVSHRLRPPAGMLAESREFATDDAVMNG